MSPSQLAILLAVVGIILLIAEMLLPTQNVLGIIGVLSIFGSIGVCFAINRWLGLGVMLAAIVASPFVATFAINLWPRTPVGRRILLPNIESRVTPPPVGIGQMGIVVSDLRPIGECEFDGNRLEAVSEHGIIGAGSKIKVVSFANDKPMVRLIA